MPRQRTDRKWRDQRDERIREAALDGHSAKWISRDANVEGVLHAAFSDCRIRGEWFNADERLARVARLLP